MHSWLAFSTETVSSSEEKWKLTNSGFSPKSIFGFIGTSARAQERVLSPKTLSRTAPMVMRLEE